MYVCLLSFSEFSVSCTPFLTSFVWYHDLELEETLLLGHSVPLAESVEDMSSSFYVFVH